MYNEQEHVTTMLDKLLNVEMPKVVSEIEYLIIDDASTDNSHQIVSDYISDYQNIRIIKHGKNQGKGAGVRTGLKEAKGNTFIIQDSDLELSPNDIPRMIEVMRDLEVGFVNASRYLPGISRTLASYRRYLGNKFFSFLTSFILNVRITDMACGYKLFNREIYENIDLTENGFGFEAELIIKALKYKKNNIAEVPVQYFPRNSGEGKKLNNFDALKIFKTIFKYGVFKKSKKRNTK